MGGFCVNLNLRQAPTCTGVDMKKTVYVTSVLALMVLSSIAVLGFGSATYVPGDVGTNGVWSSQNSPYHLTQNVQVTSGATLTIQAGTIVHLNGYQIQVHGNLNVQGTSSSKVYFLNDGNSNSQIYFAPSSTASCTLNYAVLYSVPVMIGGGAPTVSNCYFTSGSSTTITVNGGSPLITGNTINAGSQLHHHKWRLRHDYFQHACRVEFE